MQLKTTQQQLDSKSQNLTELKVHVRRSKLNVIQSTDQHPYQLENLLEARDSENNTLYNF